MAREEIRFLVAPNAFKNSLDAGSVANAIRDGLRASKLSCRIDCFPVADGGDGTAALLIRNLGGTICYGNVHDPLGREVQASYGLTDGGSTAVIEMASASGIRLLASEELDPIKATSFGTGELMGMALDRGVKRIIIAVGGSATVDGASGILEALGARFLDSAGNELHNLPKDMEKVVKVDLEWMDKRMDDCQLIVLCDVENVLLGDQGAARVFGPQKGASPEDVLMLEHRLSSFAEIAGKEFSSSATMVKGGGAAGGVAWGLHAFFNARLIPGIEYFLDVCGFDNALKDADIVITGEGRIDDQTLEGKGPYGVAVRAKKEGLPVIGLAGSISPQASSQLNKYFDFLIPIGNGPGEISFALKNTEANLRRTAGMIGDLLNLAKKADSATEKES